MAWKNEQRVGEDGIKKTGIPANDVSREVNFRN